MLKKIFIYTIVLLFSSNLLLINITFAESETNLDSKVQIASPEGNQTNDRLDIFDVFTVFLSSGDTKGAEGIKDITIEIAKDVKNLFYAIAIIYFLIITIRLLFSSNSEEGFESYKKGLIWITIGIFVMQISYSFVLSMFDKGSSSFASSLIENIFKPIISLLETFASIFFMLIAIYSFIRLLSANGDKEKQKKGIDAIIYATIGIFLVIFSSKIIKSIYGKYNIDTSGLTSIQKESSFSSFASMFINFINWMNGFVAIITLIMIMYAGVNIIFANGDEEKLKKGMTTIVYAFIGIFILVISYLILTFFIGPEGSKI